MCLLCGTMALEGANKIDNSTVKEIDLNRYMGRWYEIARFDHILSGMTVLSKL